MTLEEYRERRSELEQDIYDLIRDFEKETDARIERVQVDTVEHTAGKHVVTGVQVDDIA